MTCLGGLPGRKTCTEENTEGRMKLAQLHGWFKKDKKATRESKEKNQRGKLKKAKGEINAEGYHSERKL